VILAAATFAAPLASAQPLGSDKARAKEAYDRGVEAHKRGDMQKAAEEFARADALAPSAVALQAALDAAAEADDVALGGELLERSARESGRETPALKSSVQTARTKLGGRAGRVRVRCPAPSKCLAKVDEKFVDVDKPVWTRSGRHTVVIQVDGEAQTKLVDLQADQLLDVAPSPKTSEPAPTGTATSPENKPQPAPTPPPAEPKPRREVLKNGLPPIVFFAGLGATVLAGGVTTFLAIETSSRHDEFTNAGCDQAAFADCDDKQTVGKGLQTATNAMIGVTAVLGVLTGVVGIAFTDWHRPIVGPATRGTGGSFQLRF
jgi:hypothetical protein